MLEVSSEVEKKALARVLEVATRPGLNLIYGKEGTGKSSLALYMLQELLKDRGKAILLDSTHAADVFRRLPESVARDLLVRIVRVEVPDFGCQKRLILGISGLLPEHSRALVIDEFTFPYERAWLRVGRGISKRLALHRELIFQAAYLRYEALRSNLAVLALARERRDEEPVGGSVIRNLANTAIRLTERPSGAVLAEISSLENNLAVKVNLRFTSWMMG